MKQKVLFFWLNFANVALLLSTILDCYAKWEIETQLVDCTWVGSEDHSAAVLCGIITYNLYVIVLYNTVVESSTEPTSYDWISVFQIQNKI